MDEQTQTIATHADEPCRCGKTMLKHWWASVTDAGDEKTDYKKHSRGSCLTQTERNAARLAAHKSPPWKPARHLEETMAECEHEWASVPSGRDAGRIYCRTCDALLTPERAILLAHDLARVTAELRAAEDEVVRHRNMHAMARTLTAEGKAPSVAYVLAAETGVSMTSDQYNTLQSDLARVTAERDDWHRIADARSAETTNDWAIYDRKRRRFVPVRVQDAVNLRRFTLRPLVGSLRPVVKALEGFRLHYPDDALHMRLVPWDEQAQATHGGAPV